MPKLEINFPKVEKKEDKVQKILGQVFTDLDGIEAYARVIDMDCADESAAKHIKGIYLQIKDIREKLEAL